MAILKRYTRTVIWLCLLLILVGSGSTVYAQIPTDAVGVFYVGPEDDIARAITAASPYIVRVEQPAPDLAQVVVINNAPIAGSTLEYFGTQIREGRMGLVIFCGPNFPTSADQLNALLGVSAFELQGDNSLATVRPSELDDDLQNTANWLSAPLMGERTLVINPNMLRSVLETADEQPIMQRVRGRTETQVIIVGGWIGQDYNTTWQDWAYYPYMIYRLINDAAQMSRVLSFANYPASPVPQRTTRWGLTGIGIGLLLGTVGLYYLSRRFVFLHADRISHNLRSAQDNPREKLWQRAGFHRPLAGFLIFALWGLVLLLPAIDFQQTFLPSIFSEHTLVLKTWLDVGLWMIPAWLLIDAGVGLAAVRYYAALHIHQPERALAYLRFYFWWKLLSSTVQLGLVCLIAIWGLPVGNWAHLTYYLIIHALTQFPGILQVFVITFQASQRTDYEQSLRFLSTFGTFATQTLCIAVLPNWEWFASMFSGISTQVTLMIGTMTAQWIVFLIGAALAHRLGFRWNSLMAPQFDRYVIRRSLSYGLRAVPASLAVSVGLALQNTVIPATQTLSAYAPWVFLGIGSFDLLMQNYYQDLLPAFAEAHQSSYMALFRYTISQGLRTALWFSALLCAWISVPLLMHLGGNLTTTIQMLLPFILWGGLRWLLWLPVTILRGVERPALGSFLVLLEQVILVTLLFLTPAQSSIAGIGSFYLISLAIAGFVGWIAVNHWVTTPRVYLWQSLIVPSISALLVIQVVLRLMGFPNTGLPALSILKLSLLAYPVCLLYAGATALLGGWDEGSLEELRRAVHISVLGYPLTWLLWIVVRFCARISPLHNRFPLSIRSLAEQEAELLPLTKDKSA